MALTLQAKNLAKIESVDTNIILRLIKQDNSRQERLVTDLLLNRNCNYYVDDSVISECVYVLEKDLYSRSDIYNSLLTVLSNNIFIYDRSIFSEVFSYYLSHPSLSFEDCYLTFKVADLQTEPLWTFDKKFAAQSPSAKELK